jgi:hypothetical protein
VHRCCTMLAACSVRRANISALSPLRKALEKWSALSGKEAAKKKADTVCMIAECHTGLDNFPLGQEWFERSSEASSSPRTFSGSSMLPLPAVSLARVRGPYAKPK